MMQVEKPGLIVAPLTPFTAELDVDEGALRREIDYVVRDCRATMVVAAGVETQEYNYLGLEQRKALIRHTIACVDGRVPVMVGISHPSFRTAIELAHFAESLGAAAVQLLAPLRPFAGPPTPADLIAYFEAIGRETKLPITLYLNPGPGADVSIADTIALAKLPSVELIKESSRDLARVSRLIVEIDRAGHARYFTTMQMLLITLLLGGSGATMPPPAAEIARHIIDAYVAKDHARAAELQLQFALFPAKWMHRGLAPAMKAAMNLIGVPVGEPYPPYRSLTREETMAPARVVSRLAHAGSRISMNPSITIWPANVAVTVELSPQHNNAMPNSVGAMAEPSSGARNECTCSSSATSVLPVLLKVAAARIRIEALMSSANISAMVESRVASLIASRFSGTVSPKR